MTWATKLAEMAARNTARKAARDELSALIGGDQASIWQPRLASLTATIDRHAAECDQLSALVQAAAGTEQLQAALATRTTERDAALADALAKAAQIAALNGTITQRDATIATQSGTISAQATQITVLTGTVEARDEEIVQLNEQAVSLQAQIAALLAQLPAAGFLTFDEMRAGDVSTQGFDDILVVYESAMFPGGITQAQRATTPPDTTFLNNYFSGLKAANPTVNRVVLDLEAWTLIASGAVNSTVLGWYITLVNTAQAHFSDVGLYGELTERYTLYLNYPPGHATHISRKNAWFSRAAAMQPLWDAVDTIYPSFYYIAPVATDAADRDLWYADNAAMCAQFASGKKVIPFLWPRVHQSVDPTMPFIDGDIFRGTLDKMWELYDGFALWLEGSDPDLDTITPEPLWWTRAKEFQADHGLVP